MPKYDPVPLPRATSPMAAINGIGEWIGSAPMRDLLSEFEGELPDGGTAADLQFLDEFSAAHWDFRAGKERFEVDAESFDATRERFIREVALSLGLAGDAGPRRGHYNHILVLGGLVSSCLFRTRFAAELVAGGVSADRVCGVGGFRRFNDRDEDLAERTGFSGGRFEVDAMEEGLKRAFAITTDPEVCQEGDPDSDPNGAWKIVTYAVDGIRVQAVAAPSSDPGRRRPDTADTCRFWADRVAKLRPADSVLVVTSSLFVPFQYCDALSYIGLPYGCDVDAVGVDTTALSETYFRKKYTARDYLQEIRSTIRSMRRLRDVASAATTGAARGIVDT